MSFQRQLGLLHTLMMGLGSTICAGIFVILGPAFEIAGPAIIVSFLLCGIINLATMFSYCELGAAIPRTGGEYAYVKEAFDGLPSFLTGWYEWSSNVFYATMMVLGSASILSTLVPITKSLIVVLLAILFAAINIRGIKEAGVTQTLLTSTLLAILSLFIGVGLLQGVRADAFTPFLPNGPASVITGVAFIFEVFVGVEAIAAVQAEIRTPEKTIPRAMILCSLLLIVVFGLITYVTVGILPLDVLRQSEAPLNVVAEKTMGDVGVILLTGAGLIAALTSLNTAIIASSRVACAMGQNGHFPKQLGSLHARHKTPWVAIACSFILIILFSSIDDLEFIIYSINFGFLTGFTLVNVALIKLRQSQPNMKRPFKTPLYPLPPIVGIVTSIGLLAFFDVESLTFGIVWGLIGLVVYGIQQKATGKKREERKKGLPSDAKS